MNFEERLSAELSGVADGLERPDVSVPGLERAGRREQVRRRTAFTAAGAAAAVIVVIAAGTSPKLGSTSDTGPAIPPPSASVDPGDTPQTLADLPEGPATDLPWVKAGCSMSAGRRSTLLSRTSPTPAARRSSASTTGSRAPRGS